MDRTHFEPGIAHVKGFLINLGTSALIVTVVYCLVLTLLENMVDVCPLSRLTLICLLLIGGSTHV